MDYERIHKSQQMGVISPTKLRMKLLGVHNSRRKEGGNHSSRTSPSKLEEMEYAKNHLLTNDFDEDVSQSNVSRAAASSTDPKLDLGARANPEMVRSKSQNTTRATSYQVQSSNNSSTVHPMRSLEEDGNGYESSHENGSTSSFEFPRGERSALHHQAAGLYSRHHVPSKWNDAEKWIVNRQQMNHNASKKNAMQSQGVRHMSSSWGRSAPDMVADTKRIDSLNLAPQIVGGKFSFVHHNLKPNSVSSIAVSGSTDSSQEDHSASVPEKAIVEATVPTVESVSMRDVGTEMTPIASQEPSRTGTPMGATTPSRSPRSSMPSTPKRGEEVSVPTDIAKVHENNWQERGGKPELSDRELKLKTRREIAALGVQLGKMNIASWAHKEAELAASSPKSADVEKHVKAEYEARAAAWEEAEEAKHMARYRREEVKIQAWESHQQAKFEARMRKLEVQVERMRARTQERIAQKLTETKQQVEEKRADAEVRKNRKAARTAKQVEQIRRTGRVPPSHIRCCSWFL